MGKVPTTPEQSGPLQWIYPYPIYVVKTAPSEVYGAEFILIAGGGGKSKTGVPNAFDIVLMDMDAKKKPTLAQVHHENTEDRIIYAASFHPSLPIIAIAQGNECYIYQMITKDGAVEKLTVLQQFQSDFGGADSVQTVCEFSPDGKWLATGGEDAKVHLWSVNESLPSGKVIEKQEDIPFYDTINSIQFSADSEMLLLTAKANSNIWEIKSKKKITEITPFRKDAKGGSPAFRGGAFNQDATRFITPQGKPRQKSELTIWDSATGKHIKSHTPSLSGPPTAIYSSTRNSTQLLAVAFDEGTVETFEVSKEGNLSFFCKKTNIHSFIITALSMTEKQDYLISGSVNRSLALTAVKKTNLFVIEVLLFFFLFILLLAIIFFLFYVGFVPALRILETL